MDPLAELAVVVPIGSGDSAWRSLLPDLQVLPPEAEVVFVGTEPLATPPWTRPNWSWLQAPSGRAKQMNVGARSTTRPHLWFLHADSRFAPDTLVTLAQSIREHPDALRYFDLAFLADGPRLMKLNQLGSWMRSHWGGMPFGDQGFCLRREIWERLEGFDTHAAYGEDHLFVWKARRAGVPLRPTGGTLRTSARKYREQGWLSTTTRHFQLTALQAVPEWLKLVRAR
ncbi:hypothetical protein BH23GEM5_BH23GEM5_04390 [soil metagenome]